MMQMPVCRKLMLAAVLGAVVSVSATQAYAISFTFSGSAQGGTGSAIMDIVGIGTQTVTVTLDNTSPIVLDNSTGGNAVAMTGFGFNGNLTTANIVSWSLVATSYNSNNQSFVNTTIGGNPNQGTNDWVMTTDLSNINLDFLPQTNQAIQGALYNPNCVTSQSCVNDLAALPNYFTTAVLSITFNANFTLDISQDKKSPSPFVRMQNVGNGGSLKLSGTECTNCGGGSSAPEPGTFLLLGSGLVAFGLLRRKRNA